MAGNVVLDRAAGGRYEPGGPSLFSARMAAALGAHVTLLSRVPAAFPSGPLHDLDVRALPARHAASYENLYDPDGHRTQYLVDPGEPLPLPPAPPVPSPDALMLAPALHEFTELPDWDVPVVAVALQGILRKAARGEIVRPARDPDAVAAPFLRPGVLLFLSDEDLPGHAEAFAARTAEAGATVAVTHGARGATVWQPGRAPCSATSYPSKVIDPTGAGDCFAAAFLVHTVETGDPLAACRFATAAASLSTEGHGLAGIPTRLAVEQRMLQGAA